MAYKSISDCINDLEKNGHLIRIKEEVDAELEMAAIHLRVFENNGPAILFENIKGFEFKAVSNLFGNMERSRFMFKDTLENVKNLIRLKSDPLEAIKHPIKNSAALFTAWNALPKKKNSGSPVLYKETTIDKLPQIKCWKEDGGPFVTLPLVYSEDIDKPGVMNSNLGMYRIQLGGNDYIQNKEVGLHYQLHRGIGVHQSKSNAKGQPLKVSIFVGGPPSHSLAAVMPLPEGLSELTFAGAMGGRRFRYTYVDGYCISSDADFVITGDVYPNENKMEGPFGDHLGYYSLKHNFPVMRVHKVYHRKDAIWPFTVVGRPPQEDTSFGALIHEITGDVLPTEISGLKAVNAVDAAGVHPLLLAIGSERYTPYITERKPSEILTIANHILGFGQMSLAKYVFIVAQEDNANLTVYDIQKYFAHVLERIDFTRDLHFQTNTSIDTLDYSGTGLNSGSKLVIASAGNKKRELASTFNYENAIDCALKIKVVMPGILAIEMGKYINEQETHKEIKILSDNLSAITEQLKGFPLIVVVDDADFVSASVNNFLWVTFTRSNPAADISGVNEFTENKHWGCKGSLIIDARIKPHHAPSLIKDASIEKRVDSLGEKGGSLFGVI